MTLSTTEDTGDTQARPVLKKDLSLLSSVVESLRR